MESRMLGPRESPRPSTSEWTTEERKVVSVLFADLVDFTAYSDEADPEDVRALLRPYHAAAKHEIDAHGGRVEKFVGDAVMGIFGAPTAHEDDAERAVRAAVAILERVDELNRAHPKLGLAVRAAVATGDVIVDLGAEAERGESVLAGDVVNTAARLQTAAAPGSVIVGERTYLATREVVDYEELGALVVKGKADPVLAWRARNLRAALRAPVEAVTPFVGRAEDLALLERTFARVLRESSVQLVTVVGEPGIGKTRLIAEFRHHVEGGPDTVTWRRGRCLPYGEGVTFWALGEIVKAEAGILESDGPEDARRKLGAVLRQVVREPSEREWLVRQVAPLVGAQESDEVGADERAESAFTAWTRFLEAIAAARPLVLVIEDIHWADDPLLSFLEHLVDWAVEVPLLVTCTARPDLYERRPGWGGGKRNSATIALSPLTGEETSVLLDALLAEIELPPETRDALLERAGGNPLYTEQFVRMLVDQGILEVGQSIRSDMPIRVPETVQAVISARLDTLTGEQKGVLQDAAVLGKVFWTGALAFMSGRRPDEIEDLVHELTRKELVRRVRTSSVREQLEYAFGHVLVRDVAYGQIPRIPRAQRHKAAAAWIEQLAGERVIDHAELLAHHYVQALELARAAGERPVSSELEDAARRFLVLAGDRALQVNVDRAEAYYRQALGLLTPDDPIRPRVMAALGEAARLAGRMPEAERLYAEAIPAVRSQGDVRAVGEAMIGLVQVLRDRGKTESARELLAEATALLEQAEKPGRELALAYLHAARDASVSGRAREAIPAAEKAIELCRRLGLEHHVARALQFRGIPRLDLGDVGGMADMEQSLQLCLGLGLGYYTANAYGNLADALMRVAGPERALERYREGITFGERRGIVFKARWIEAETVWPLYDLGRWDEVLEIADRLVEWDQAYGQSQVSLIASSYKTYVLAQRGEVREAQRLHDDVLARARESGDEQVLAPSLTVGAIISQAAGDLKAAAGYVREFSAMGESGYWPMTLADAVRVAISAQELELAESLLHDAAALTPRGEYMLLAAQAAIAEARRDLERSLELHEHALASWAAFGNVVEHAHAVAGVGRCLAALGRKADARARLGEAREVFAALDARPFVTDIDAALAEVT